MSDMILTCSRCHSSFYFTAGEQKFYKEKGLNIPKLCPNCRKQKRPKEQWVPRACSTCYFKTRNNIEVKHGTHPYTYSTTETVDWCNRSNRQIINDAPCAHWAKKPKNN